MLNLPAGYPLAPDDTDQSHAEPAQSSPSHILSFTEELAQGHTQSAAWPTRLAGQNYSPQVEIGKVLIR